MPNSIPLFSKSLLYFDLWGQHALTGSALECPFRRTSHHPIIQWIPPKVLKRSFLATTFEWLPEALLYNGMFCKDRASLHQQPQTQSRIHSWRKWNLRTAQRAIERKEKGWMKWGGQESWSKTKWSAARNKQQRQEQPLQTQAINNSNNNQEQEWEL